MYKIKYILFLLGLFFIQSTIFSQQAAADIEIIHFNSSASYAYGSGISIHINPKGIFKLGDSQSLGSQNVNNNVFILELSSENGSFDNPITLATIYDFYTPLINGVIPSSIIAGDYKLRVKASLGLQSSDGNIDFETSTDYGIVYSDEVDIQISAQTLNSGLVLNNPTPTDSNVFNCLLDNSVNPSIGSLIVSSDSNSSGFSSPTVYITDFESNNLTITLFDIINSTSQNISTTTLDNSIAFDIPDDLQIGTYTIEVQEIINESGLSNISSFSFLWHRNSTSLTNLDNEEICVGSEVGFTIATDSEDGVGGNYTGSYYSLDFGDGTNPEIFTHAYLLVSNQFVHEFQGASCLLDGENGFEVTKLLYNNKNCLGYEENGQGKTTEVSASIPPTANFDFSDQYCINPEIVENLVILNETDLGQYSSSSSSNCLDLSDYFWFVQRPSDTDFLAINAFSFPLWTTNIDINGDNLPDLIIPDSDLSGDPGCWNFRLSAENNEGALCNSGVFAEGTVQVLVQPDVNFNIQDLTGNIVSEICPGETVTLNNLTDALELDCQDLNFEWDINPTQPDEIDNHCSFVQNTNPFSESPIVTFNEPGIYQITLTVTNGVCEAETFSYTFTVQGTPGVTLNANVGDEQVCLDDIDISNPFIVNFSTQYSPQYTAEPFEPNSFSWEVTGQGITEDDYSYINGTSNNSDFPVIEFYSFECYNISVSVDSACETSSTDSFNFSIDQNPIANFEILNTSGEVVGLICPGDTVQLNDLSEISGEGCQDVTYLWGISALVPGTPAQHCAPATGSTWTDPSPYIEFIEPGVFEISVQVTAGNCPVGEYTDTIIVEGPPSVSIDVDGESSVQVCLDSISSSVPNQIDFSQTYTPIYSNDTGSNGQLYNSPINYLWEISGLGITSDDYAFVNGNQPSSSAFPVIEFYSFGDYTITTTVEGNCEVSDENIFIYSINEIPSITNPDSDFEQIICSGEFTELLEFTSSVENTTFTWNFSTADTYLSGYNNETINTGNFEQQLIINSTNITGQVIFEVTPSTIDCTGETKLVTVIVNPTPEINNFTQTICDGISFSDTTPLNSTNGIVPSDTTYEWEVDASSSSEITGGESGSGNTIPGSVLVNTSNTPQDFIYKVTPTSGDCIGEDFLITITVNPDAQISDISNTICNEGSFSIDPSSISGNIVPTGTTYSWVTPVSDPLGVIESTAANDQGLISQSLSNTANSAATLTYTVIPKSGDCSGTPFIVTITVNPEPQISNVLETICEDSSFSSVDPNTITGNIVPSDTTYEWEVDASSSSEITGGESGSGNTIPGSVLVNTSNTPQDFIYKVTPTSGDCIGEDFLITITVNPSAEMTEPDDLVICNGQQETIDFVTSNTGGETSYTWENTGGVDIGLSSDNGTINDSSLDITFTAQNSGSSAISTEITVTPTFTNNSLACVATTTQTFTITVNPTTNVTSFDDQFIFTGGTTESVTIESVTENVTYSWEVTSIATGIEGLQNTSGTTNTIPAETLILAEGINTPLDVVYTITPSASGDEVCPGNPYAYTVTVNPITGVTFINDIVVCHNTEVGPIEFTSTVEGGTTTYEWENSGDDINLTQTDDGTGIIELFTAENLTLDPLVATVTVIPTLTNGGASSVGDPLTFTITVNPDAQISDISNTICNEGSFSIDPSSISGNIVPTGTTYSWVTPVSDPLGVIESTAANDQGLISQSLSNTANSAATLTYTVIPKSGDCSGTPFIVTITVNPEPQISNVLETICEDSSFSSVDPNTITGNIVPSDTTYEWEVDASSSSEITGGESGSGNTIPGSVLVNTSNTPQDFIYKVTPTSGDCIGEDFLITITVNPSAEMTEPDDLVICNGQQETIDFVTSNTGGETSYTWENTGGVDIGLSSDNGTINDSSLDITFTAQNSGSSAISTEITVTPTFTNNSLACVATTTQTFTITVNPEPQISNVLETICEDSSFSSVDPNTITGNIVPSDTTYEWEVDASSSSEITGGESGSGNTIPGSVLVNTSNTPQDFIYKVTPTSGDCIGEDFLITITVNPSAEMTEPDDLVICNGQQETIDFVTSNTGGETSYTWENTGGVDIGLSSDNGTINDSSLDITFTAQNSGSSAISTEITVTPTFTNNSLACVATTTQTFTITVNPTTNVTSFDDQFIFTGGTTESVTIESVTENVTYSWEVTSIATGIEGLQNTSGTTNTIPAETLILAEGINTPLDVVYTITPSASGDEVCPGNPYAYTVTVNPITGVTFINDIVVCHNTEVGPIEFTSTVEGGTTTYEWENSGDDINLTQTDDGTGIIELFTAENLTLDPLVATVTVIPTLTNGGASSVGDPLTFTITVNPTGQVDQPDNYAYCDGDTAVVDFTTSNTGANSDTTYSWSIGGDDIGLDASIAGDISQQITNETTDTLTAIVVVTPTYTNAGADCIGPSKEFTITVSPTAQVNAIAPITYCKGELWRLFYLVL